MPLSTNYTSRFSGDFLQPANSTQQAETIAVSLQPSTTFPQACLLQDGGTGVLNGQAVTSIFQPYTPGGTPVLLLKRACVTDANGNITFGSQSGGMEFGQTYPAADAYFKGLFRTQDLPQSGTGAITAESVAPGGAHRLGKLIQGTTASGLILLG